MAAWGLQIETMRSFGVCSKPSRFVDLYKDDLTVMRAHYCTAYVLLGDPIQIR
jgi:hypothetical protein